MFWKDQPVARAKKSRPRKPAPAKSAKPAGGEEFTLTKGQARKLEALRKSLGDQIADKAFAEWLRRGAAQQSAQVDKNAELIADTLGPLAKSGKLRIPRGGYLVSRGRRRVIVERAQGE